MSVHSVSCKVYVAVGDVAESGSGMTEGETGRYLSGVLRDTVEVCAVKYLTPDRQTTPLTD